MALPGVPTLDEFYVVVGTNIHIAFTQGSGATHTDIDFTQDTGDWGTVNYPHQAGTSYDIDLGATGTWYVRIRAENGDGYSAWTSTYYVDCYARPSDWAWNVTIVTGNAVALTAADFNNFTDKINDFRLYYGYTTYSFTDVVAGANMLATEFNTARTKIDTMSPPTTLPAAVTAGTSGVTAAQLNGLKNSLNSL